MRDTSLSSPINRISLTTSPNREQPITGSNLVRPCPGSRREKDHHEGIEEREEWKAGKRKRKGEKEKNLAQLVRQQMKQNMKKTIPGKYKIYMPINFLMIWKILDIINPFKKPWMTEPSEKAKLWERVLSLPFETVKTESHSWEGYCS